MNVDDRFVLLTGRSNPKLAKEIGQLLSVSVHESISTFADAETRVRIAANLRRRHVYIIQPTSAPVNDHVIELLFMIDAAKRSSASEIIVIVPYFGYARQDRKEMPHVPISASVVANMLVDVGADRIATVDIHSEQLQGCVNVAWDNLYGSYSLVPVIKERKLNNLLLASPDKGGMTRATGYAKLLGAAGIALVYKQRDIAVNNKSDVLGMIGDVKDKNVIIVDDMIDTAGTIVNAADFIKDHGAKSIRAVATHGVFSKEALDRIENSAIEEVIITDTIAQKPEVIENPKITIVPIARLLAESIKRIESGESISRDLIL